MSAATARRAVGDRSAAMESSTRDAREALEEVEAAYARDLEEAAATTEAERAKLAKRAETLVARAAARAAEDAVSLQSSKRFSFFEIFSYLPNFGKIKFARCIGRRFH